MDRNGRGGEGGGVLTTGTNRKRQEEVAEGAYMMHLVQHAFHQYGQKKRLALAFINQHSRSTLLKIIMSNNS